MLASRVLRLLVTLCVLSRAPMVAMAALGHDGNDTVGHQVRPLPPIDPPSIETLFETAPVQLVSAHSVILDEEPGSYALTDLEQIALNHSPTIDWAEARVAAAEGNYLQVGLPPNPTVGYLAEEMGDLGTAGKQGGFIRQNFITGGKLRLSRDVAEEETRMAEQELAAWRVRMLADVRSAFYDALAAQRRIELIEVLVEIGDQGVRSAEGLVRGGEVSRVDLLQARIEASRVRIACDTARAAHAAAWRRLAAVVGSPNLALGQLAGQLDEKIPQLDWETSLTRILQESPQIASAFIRIERAERVVCRQLAERKPDIDVQVAIQHDNITDDALAGVTVGLPLQLWNRNQGNIDRAHSDLIAAHHHAQRVELALHVRLAEAFGGYAGARDEAARYAQDILPGAKDALDLVSAGYRRGELNYLTLLTAQRTYSQANLAYIDALVRLRQSVVQIESFTLKDNFGSRQ